MEKVGLTINYDATTIEKRAYNTHLSCNVAVLSQLYIMLTGISGS